ncbi:MAG: PilZ domain-containing protein [Candidatus Nitrotoga sp. SPKER]|nr:MAG: PilZ domain-containing protein [Candidatus Nitrotoga sp. SPKER]
MIKPYDQEKRHFSRIPFHADVKLYFALPDIVQAATLLNISFKGALIETLQPINLDENKICRSTLSLNENGENIIMEGTIIYQKGSFIGLKCQHIDMDSMINLRRLVELHLGDPSLLDKELAGVLNSQPLNSITL